MNSFAALSEPFLFANSQPLDESPVPLHILGLEVVEEMPPLSHELQQPPAGMMIFNMRFEMVRQIIDPFAQDRNLDFRRSRIRGVRLEPLDDFLLSLWH